MCNDYVIYGIDNASRNKVIVKQRLDNTLQLPTLVPAVSFIRVIAQTTVLADDDCLESA